MPKRFKYIYGIFLITINLVIISCACFAYDGNFYKTGLVSDIKIALGQPQKDSLQNKKDALSSTESIEIEIKELEEEKELSQKLSLTGYLLDVLVVPPSMFLLSTSNPYPDYIYWGNIMVGYDIAFLLMPHSKKTTSNWIAMPLISMGSTLFFYAVVPQIVSDKTTGFFISTWGSASVSVFIRVVGYGLHKERVDKIIKDLKNPKKEKPVNPSPGRMELGFNPENKTYYVLYKTEF